MRLTVRRRRPFALALAMSLLAAIIPVSGVADDTPPPISVAVAGSFQSELGCPGDWQPECAVTDLAQLTPTVWKSTFTLPAGDWEYKATLDDSWDENYGANAVRNGANISLSLAEQTEVAFYYSHATHWITDSVNSTVATAAGSFQSELGCPGDWQPDCLVSWLQDPDGDGVYTFVTDAIPAGDHESKAALDEAWDVSYPASNLAFTVTDGATVTFSFVAATTEFMVQVDTPGGGLEPGDEGLVSAPARPPVSETIYFVMPDRFEDGDPTNDRAGVAVDDPLVHGYLPTDKGYYHGGDIAGLTSRLDYLDGLGVTAIWLTPMFTNNWVQGDGTIAGSSAAYHGYWQIDYGQIDPHFGTNAEMQALVAAAHTRGINVYFDIVANHTGDIIDFAGASTPYISKADQPYRDSSGVAFDDRDYVGTGTFPDLDPAVSFSYAPILSDPGDDTAKFPAWLNDPIYYHNRGDSTFTGENSLYGDFFGLDDLFTEHPVVQDGLIDIFKGMISDFDIDGFRLDTVKHVNDEFWLAFVDEIEAHAASLGKGDFYFFGEVFDGDPAFLSRFTTELGLPGVLDFRFHGAALGFAANSNATTGLEAMFADDDWFTDGDSSAHGLTTFVGNHDVGRFGHFLRQANPGASDAELTARSVLGHSLMFLGRGMPVVYYGDEQGFTGDGGDKDARHDMFVSQVASYNDDDLIGTTATTADANFDTTHPLYSTIAELAALRADHPALQTGAQIHRYAQGSAGIYAFSRIDRADNVEYLAVLNNAEATASATFATDSPSTTFTPLFGTSDGVTSDADGVVTVELPALGAVLYRAETAVPVPSVAPSVAIAVPAAGSQVAGRVEVRAEVDADGPAEVTFAASVGGGGFQVIGTDDAAPYRVFHDVSAIPAGTEVTYRAIAADTGGGLAADGVTVTTGDVTPPPPSETNRYGIIHYLRSDGDYGDHTTGDYNDFWGLHLWDGVAEPSEWTAPLPFLGEDEYGRFAWFELTPGADNVGFIVHRGDTKDGTDADRFFDPSANPEIWLRSDDAAVYTSQADAQGYVTIHYQRGDDNYGIGTSDYWGLHLWGDAIDPAEGTSWDAPKPPDEIDDYGAFWTVDVVGVTEPVNFIVHQPNGDTPGVNRELSIDRSFIPADQPSAWLLQDEEPVHAQRGEALDFATIRYHRADGDYGDHTSTDFNDFWGLHVWNGAASPNPSWQEPVKPVGFDIFGPIFEIDLVEGAPELAYIIHRGDIKDPGPDQFLDFATFGYEVWQLEDADPASPYLLPILDGGQVSRGDLGRQQAHWVDADTIVWDVEAAEAALCWSMSASLALADAGLSGADDCLPLSAAGTFDDAPDGFLHLQGLPAWTVDAGDLHTEILTAQHAVVAATDGVRVDATGVQIPGVLDDVYATDAPLGVSWDGAVPTVSVWAPTARSVALHRYENSTTDTVDVLELTRSGGVWSVTGDPSWNGDFYLYEVEVFVPSTGMVETNMVTDPYSVSLAQNSTRSQIVDLADPSLVPDGWGDLSKPQVGSFEEIAIYEIHVRDFSVNDPTVPDDLKGTFAAFTVDGSDGMTHLAGLAEAGITHLHLLPAFDIATIDEDKDNWQSPDFADLHASPPDSEEQQALVSAVRDLDGFNWGYDPLHYTTPEGSYSTDPDGPQRTVEFREMVASINDTGLGVVMDVVYNHTNSAGQAATSVLDRLVPGYYQRLDADGVVATSTCCANTATEHEMMGRLMVDSVVTWAKEYKVDGFRFDLMGHHSKQNMADVRAALDALTLDADGVDGSAIFLYGEGWNFGEVANDARFVQATQANMAGTGIATFNDRLRDGVRGGGPFDGGLGLRINQGFINGLWYDPNEVAMPEADALAELLLSADQIRVGLAGNLADFTFVDRTGATVTGAQVDYNASPTGYNADPQENIVYVSAHDNQTLFDIGQYHHPMDATIEERVRAQNLGIDITALAQGVSFFHAGVDMLRSKSLDRDSFNSGDWFNRLDFTYQDNGWGSGLPPEGVNGDNWDIMRPLLGSLESPSPDDIEATVAHMQEILAIRTSSDLFSLQTAADVHDRVAFHNTGPDQTPGLIVMSIDDTVGDDLDPEADAVWTLINASDEPAVFEVSELDGADVVLHPVQAVSVDPVVRTASFEGGVFSIPARTTAVFVELEPDTTAPTVEASLDLIHERGTNGVFDVSVTCTDDRSAVTIEIDINGVEVDDGTRVFLITSGGPQRWRQIGGETWIWAPTFIMTVRCTDEAGNTTVVVVEPDLTPPGAQ
jgi:pullulanase-type alpha-1,6-glucosidase